MPSYSSRSDAVLSRQLKVQRLTIPFKIVGSATAAAVVITRDEPGILFLKTDGVDQITPRLNVPNETPLGGAPPPTLSATSDSSGSFDLMLEINEPLAKVMAGRVVRRDVANKQYQCKLDNLGTGIVLDLRLVAGTPGSPNVDYRGTKIVLQCVGDLALNSGSNTFDGCVEVEYVVDESTNPGSL